MPGKLCFGKVTNNAGAGMLRESKAYCEGMAYRASGTAVAKPITDNPHVADSEAGIAWDTGWSTADNNVGSTVPATSLGCCAAVPAVPA